MGLIFRSPAYLAWIRRQPCTVCGGHGSQACHETLGEGSKAIKPPDSQTIPLCRSCHNLEHCEHDYSVLLDVKLVIIKLLTRYLKEKQDGKA